MTVPWLRSYLRRPALLSVAVGLVTASQGIVIVWSRSEQWSGHWPSTSATVGWAVLFGASVSAAAAAWVIASPRRARYRDLLAASSRSPIRVYAVGLVAVGFGSFAGYASVVGYMVTVTAPTATHGNLNEWDLLPVLGSIPAAVGTGAAVGRIAPPLLAPLLAAVVPYLGNGIVVYADFYFFSRPVLEDLWPMDDRDRSHLAAPWELLGLKGFLGLAFGAAVVGWTLSARRLAFAGSALTSVTLAGVILLAGVRMEVPDSYRAICTDDKPVVCVDRAHDHLLNQYQEHVAAELAKLPGLDLSGTAFVHSHTLFDLSNRFTGTAPELEAEHVIVAPVSKGNTAPAHQIDARRFTADFGYTLLAQACVGSPSERWDGLLLYELWLITNGLPTDGSNFPGEPNLARLLGTEPQLQKQRTDLAALTATEQATRFATRARAVLSCASSAGSQSE